MTTRLIRVHQAHASQPYVRDMVISYQDKRRMTSQIRSHESQCLVLHQDISKSVVLSRIFAVAHLFIPRQNNVHDNTSNLLRSEAMRASAWYCIRTLANLWY
uniref:Uncharacterized protein n=1 Tax=Octopus bimaculoides TaxID=37653 RepID=A0A0L8FNA5_OCTBM